MNTLFIGPYHQTDYVGSIARCYLDHILSSNTHQKTLVCRPLYLNNQDTNPLDTNNGKLVENKTIIQHVPIDMFVGHTKFVNNILIPIIDHKKEINSKFRDSLELATKILVNNSIDYNKLLHCNLNPKKLSIFSIKPKVDINLLNKKIDLGIYDSLYKYYFIGEYKSNTDILQKLITSFLYSFRDKESVCLVLWLSSTEQERVELLKFYEDLKKRLKIVRGIDPIVFISRPINFKETILMHSCGDVYLAINDDYYPTIDEYYSSMYKKQIINKSTLETIKLPDLSLDDYNIGDYYRSITIESLSQQMLKKFDQTSTSSYTNKYSKNKIDLLELI